MNFGVVIAARAASRRLPGKALLPLFGMEILRLVIKRLKTSKLCEHFVLATTTNPEDDQLANIATDERIEAYRGSQDDVLGRYVKAVEFFFPEDIQYVVRVTADCPLVGGDTLDVVLRQCREIGSFDLVTTKPAFHHGLDYEVCPRELLKNIDARKETDAQDREHIFNYIYNREAQFSVMRLSPPDTLLPHGVSFLLDCQQDYDFFQKLLTPEITWDAPAEELLRINLHEN